MSDRSRRPTGTAPLRLEWTRWARAALPYLAPPLIASLDPDTGRPIKSTYGAWMRLAMGLVARFKGLRGTPFDPFGYTHERRTERRLIKAYETVVAELIAGLDHDNHALAVEIAGVPEHIRGFGHVKQAHMVKAKRCEAELLETFRKPSPHATAAE